MSQSISTIIVPVTDVAASTKFYAELLGEKPYMDSPYYVGFRFGDQELGLDPNGHAKGRTMPIAFCEVPDVAKGVKSLTKAGAVILEEPTDVGGGKIIATVKDPDGNLIGLMHTP